jgi:FAD/FMN-containing dehydrogenase
MSVEPVQLLAALLELARDTGLCVRALGGGSGGDAAPPASSGVCRVRGELWVLLADSDPAARRVDVLAGALCDHAPDLLERHYLPPAVRECLEARGRTPQGRGG